jgi:5-methylcytosine-specific restriction endonuclease McrA
VAANLKAWQAECGAAWNRQWRADNPMKVIAHRTNRRQRERASGSFTAEEFTALVKRQGFRCVYCPADLRKVRPSPDHIMPLASGGSNLISNIQATCFPCNRLKNRRDPFDFAQLLGRLL